MLKDWIRPLLRPLPQWSTIAAAPPSTIVTATLRWHGQEADVTADHTVAALKPLVIATSVDAGEQPVLEYRDSVSGSLLGRLQLQRCGSVATDQHTIALYQVSAGEHHCLAWPQRQWHAWLQNRSMLKNRQPQHLGMEPQAVQQLMIAYLCPRPVVLVSVSVPGHRNIFPMDLIGPLQRSGLYSLALRSTNISEPVMREARKVVLSSVPAAMKATVYKLSEHHKQPPSDWAALPFPLRPSHEYAIPAVAAALHIRELQIVHSERIGSHTFFLARVSANEKLADGEQLHHTAGFHQAYRRQRHAPFVEV
ncbi:flavin reductase [Dyella acidiphila]|uniref:Flavin reductase n=1 Tax=Dyella acidiphila TaxID=2775866 RepID=A0ABR9GE99_9GAMM|nr:flavin reductase [Dyella acidiphila]MBE1162379.1 flavin reductase [Dyella acidiphila]